MAWQQLDAVHPVRRALLCAGAAAGAALLAWGAWAAGQMAAAVLLPALWAGAAIWGYERLRSKRSAQDAHARLVSQMRAVLDHAAVGLVITINRRMVIVSRAFCTLFGYSEAELLGQPGRLIYTSDESYAAIGPRVAAAFAERGQFDEEMEMARSDGTAFWCQLTGRPVDRGNPAAGTMWVIYDITTMRAQRQQLEWASSHDPLTGLANRAAFERKLDQLLAREPDGRPAGAVLMLDLDHFKHVNDTGGHAAGDRLLCDVAELMARRLRQSDLVARLGGDEFGIVLDRCDLDAAMHIANTLRQQVADYRLHWQQASYGVGVSTGVAMIEPGADRTALVAAVDGACYAAKRAGRNQVRSAGDDVHASLAAEA